MNTVLMCNNFLQSFTYQHIQGVMLLNLNLLSSKLPLSHQEYRLMGILIGLWNKNFLFAFPTTDYLAKYCKMSKSTINYCLLSLKNKGLLVVLKTKGKRNRYGFTNCLFEGLNKTHKKPGLSFSCSTGHV
ncbi:MAG: helix-turn-helix domain-containing protein [Cyanobacteriota bacterium]